jgi:hypothetical protein
LTTQAASARTWRPELPMNCINGDWILFLDEVVRPTAG